MESNRQEYSVYSSDQEVDQPEQENNFGVGRSYECVFCRRGFNTAQALGGHMNIHRKDRPRNKPSTIDTNKHEEDHIGLRFYQQTPSCSTHHVAPHEAVQTEYGTYFPASTSSARPFYTNHHSIYDNQQRFNPFGDDRRLSLSLPFGPGIVEEIGKSRRGGIQEEELDLELRLGP